MTETKKTAVIIGAGPSGLALAYELIKSGSGIIPVIIEKHGCVGGLARTIYDNGSGVDIGGHRLYTKDKYIQKIWNEFLPVQGFPSADDILSGRNVKYLLSGANPEKENNVMLIRKRFSSIFFDGKMFQYPIKLNYNTVKNLGLLTTIKAGFSYLKSLFIKKDESNLENFFINRFGKVLYSIFFKDYTKKVWGVDASILSCDWGKERIKKLSLLKTILNALFLNLPIFKNLKEKSLIDEFYYPKFGCSQLWELMAEYIVKNGGKIVFNAEYSSFEYTDYKIYQMKYKKDGNTYSISGNYFISSIPISELVKGIDLPLDVKQSALLLPYRDYILVSFYTSKFNLKNSTDYITVNNITPECWIYLQDNSAIAARLQIMNNWSPYLVKDFQNKYLVSLEYYFNEGDEFWGKTDEDIKKIALDECKKLNLFFEEDVIKTKVIREKKAYPCYFGSYKNIDKIKKEINKYENLNLIGRNGEHKYNNMDEAMLSGINVAKRIIQQVKNEKQMP